MKNLSTNYLGIELRNPIIASSSGLTSTLKDIINLETNGAGAVILKSIFEEEIVLETQDNFNKMQISGFIYPETMEYFDYEEMEDSVSSYLKLISDAKKNVKIPIIASINCVTSTQWPLFAKRIQEAGADAIELNIFILPSDLNRTDKDNESIYFDAIDKVSSVVTIPISVKISPYNTALSNFIKRLSETKIKGITLFNRYYNPDFDIHNFEFTSANVLSNPAELALPLRWIAIMSDRVSCDLSGSTGVHDGIGAIKLLLAGAKTVQICSALYKNGFKYTQHIIKQIEDWMDEKRYNSIDDFRGKLSQSRSYNPAAFERVQFMQYFRERERPF